MAQSDATCHLHVQLCQLVVDLHSRMEAVQSCILVQSS